MVAGLGYHLLSSGRRDGLVTAGASRPAARLSLTGRPFHTTIPVCFAPP
jgi:hypothetical protein